jgi:glycolate oxidase
MNTQFIEALIKNVGSSYVYLDQDRREAYDFDGTDEHYLPDVVVEPINAEQIAELMKLATQYRVPVIPRGTATGLTGGALAIHGGVILSLLRMNKILKIDEFNMIAVVQPGVINLELHQAVEEKGLYYPPDPASYETSCIGGNIAEDAGGPHCYKYGTTRDYVLGMTVVLPNGNIIKTGVQTRKGVVGYDIHDLIIGSEGTLAIVTEATLRLIPLPEHVITLLAFFPDVTDVKNSLAELIKKRIVPATMEFMDSACTDIVRDKLPFQIPTGTNALLIIELDGEKEILDKQMEIVGEICLTAGAFDLFVADSSHKRQGLWNVRRQLRETIKANVKFKRAEDVVVPVSEIPTLIATCETIAKKYGLKSYNFGHLGDGNVHVNLTHSLKNEEIKRQANEAFTEILKATLELGGTISGEHGIGITKQPFLELELSKESIRLQKEIKKIFDPYNILNPGKIFPE